MSASSSLPASFPPQNSTDRAALLAWIESASLVYGPWREFKRLFKAAEGEFVADQRETEVLAALIARLDTAPLLSERRASGTPPVVRGQFTVLRFAHGLLYALEGETLLVFDPAAPLEPREIYRWAPPETTGGYGFQLWIEGTRLIFGSGRVLRVFDLSEPRAPRFLFETSVPSASNIAVRGDSVFASDFQTLRVFRLPNSAQEKPVALGEIALPYANSMTAHANLVAASHYQSSSRSYQISLFDVSNRSAPTLVGQIRAQSARDWCFVGDTLLRLDNEDLVLTDLSRPEKPREIGKIKVPGAHGFCLAEGRVYLSCSRWQQATGYEHKLRIVDISQPHSPRLVGETDTSAGAMAHAGGLLYFCNAGLRILDVSDPARPQLVGQRPKDETFGYLKRRARRLLRVLEQGKLEGFVPLASQILQRAGRDRDALDLKWQWVSAEIVSGGGARWHQSSHGRGAYVKDPRKLVIRAREERAPAAWDAHLDAVRALWEAPLAWQIGEMARRILLANGQPVSPPSAAQLERFLWSDSPALLTYAKREARTRQNELSPRALAALLWASNGAQRRAVLEGTAPGAAIATHLATLLGQNGRDGLTRRAREVALLLAARFDLSDLSFQSDGALPALPALLSSAEAPLRALALGFCRRLSAPRALETLALLPGLPLASRDSFVLALCESAASGALTSEAIDRAVRHSDAAVRDAAWQLVAASSTPHESLRAVWLRLFAGLRREPLYAGERYRSRYLGERWIESTALQSAVGSDAALSTLARCDLDVRQVRPRFGGALYLGKAENIVSPAIWGAYSLILPPDQVLQVVLKVSQWASWSDAWVRANAPQPAKLAAFWNAVQTFLDSDADAAHKQTLRERTFEQSNVAATFGGAASQLSPSLLVALIGAIPNNLWAQWRASLLQTLRDDAPTREAFWEAARRSSALEGGFLRARLIEDAEFAATFGLLENDALQADNPAFTPLLLAWLDARRDTLTREGWIEAAIHPLPAVRERALAQLDVLGLDVPGALRLLESKLPPSIAFGRAWFDRQTGNELELALALCDSPQPGVRLFGREYIAAHLETLAAGGLLAYLQDNPNAEMQAFVAAQLKEKPEAAAPDFDRAVLRSRSRARRAKTLVQERRNVSAPLPDERTLLELARSRTPRDSEWALSQLARRALEGATIEGVEVGERAAI